jgi:cell division protein FtsQ
LLKKIENFNLNNIFLINKIDLKDEIESNTLVENYSIFKRYPSALDINIEKTKFLAKINKNGHIFYVGSNGKFIKNSSLNNELPFIFEIQRYLNFLKLKK